MTKQATQVGVTSTQSISHIINEVDAYTRKDPKFRRINHIINNSKEHTKNGDYPKSIKATKLAKAELDQLIKKLLER